MSDAGKPVGVTVFFDKPGLYEVNATFIPESGNTFAVQERPPLVAARRLEPVPLEKYAVFEEWCESVRDCGYVVQPNSATARQRRLGWNACDAAWRERLQSGEMVEKSVKALIPFVEVIQPQGIVGGGEDGTLTIANARELARAVIAAILEEKP